MSNHAANTDIKNATGTDTSKLTAKSGLANLKDEIDEIDVNN